MERLIMVEIAAVDRPVRAIAFPYIFDRARRSGLPARWLRFAVPAAHRALRKETGIGLDGPDLETLSTAMVAFGPTRIVFNRTPTTALLEQIHGWCSGAHVAVAPEGSRPNVAGLEVLGGESRDWDLFLGLPASDDRPLLPDFGFEPANEAARVLPPIPTLCIGPSCTYSRSIRSNPVFQDVPLDSDVRDVGCAFCEHFALDGNRHRFTVKALREQFEALRRTLSFPPGRLLVRLVGDSLVRQIGKVVELLLTLDLPALDLALDSRADHVVLYRRHLADAAGKLAGSPHRINFFLVGIENFSRPELERMNKGVTPLLNLQAIRSLLELEQTYPDTFTFRESGGLSLILCTPWTTLDDLALNLRLIRTCGIEGLTGKLDSRLRLTPTMALTALARRDDLLVDAFPDQVFGTAAANLYETELPWRFAQPEVEAVGRILARLFGEPARNDGTLGPAVSRAVESRGGGLQQTLDLAIEITEAARKAVGASDAPIDPEQLLAAVADPGPGLSDVHPGLDPEFLRISIASLKGQVRDGLRKVARLELPGHEDAADILDSHDFPNARIRFGKGPGGSTPEILFGDSRESVQKALESIQQGASSEAALVEVGRMLGYPDCCIAAYLAEPSRDNTSALFLKRRLSAGRLDSTLNPWPMLHGAHVPCTADCEATRRRASDIWKSFGRTVDPVLFARVSEAAANPWLVALEPEGMAIELVPESTPGDRFRYSPGLVTCDRSHVADAARNADEIVVEPERLLLLSNGRPVADLSVRAWVWWHQRPLQVDFWSRVLEVRDRMNAVRLSDRQGHSPRLDESSKFQSRVERLARWIGAVDQGLKAAASPVDPGTNEAAIRVTSGSDSLILVATPADLATRPLFTVGTVALFYREPTGLDSASLRTILDRLGAALEQVGRYQSAGERRGSRNPGGEQRQ